MCSKSKGKPPLSLNYVMIACCINCVRSYIVDGRSGVYIIGVYILIYYNTTSPQMLCLTMAPEPKKHSELRDERRGYTCAPHVRRTTLPPLMPSAITRLNFRSREARFIPSTGTTQRWTRSHVRRSLWPYYLCV